MILSHKEMTEAARDAIKTPEVVISTEIMALLEKRVNEGVLTDFAATVAVLEAAMAWIIAVAPAGLEARGLDLGATHMAERKQQFLERGYLDDIAKHKLNEGEHIVRAMRDRLRREGL